MQAKEIHSLLSENEKTKKYFKGVFPIDKLPRKIAKFPAILIVNSHGDKTIGEHWILFLLKFENENYFFDSYSLDYTFYASRNDWEKWLKTIGVTKYMKQNPRVIQSLFSDVCGHHSLFFAYNRCAGLSSDCILNKIYKKYDLLENDRIAIRFVEKLKFSTNYFYTSSNKKPIYSRYKLLNEIYT